MWTHSNRSMSFSYWGFTELDTALQVGCQNNWLEVFPLPADHTALDAAQHRVGCLRCECIWLGHVQFLSSTNINQHPQALLFRAALNPFSTQLVFVPGITLAPMQCLAFGLVELHKAHMGPLLNPVKVSLDGTSTMQLGIVDNLNKGALDPPIHVVYKDGNQCQSQYLSLRNATQSWTPLAHRAVHHSSLSGTISLFLTHLAICGRSDSHRNWAG